ncbi:MAG: FkbM family methyltransferase [Lentisphaeraceae bacterium]|nr:FkbM family methyltransferase [Lentisphaeraceae bacterium]
MENQAQISYPSELKEFHINNAGKDYSILIPQNEEFRIHEIFNKKEYYIPGIQKMATPKVIDIGGNVGLFSMFIKFLNPNAEINAYEPAPNTFELLKTNMLQFPEVKIHRRGLSNFTGKAEINLSSLSTGCTSMKDIGKDHESQTIKLVEASKVVEKYDEVDIMKIDTEGCEFEILSNLKENKLLSKVKFIMLEYHSEKDRRQIDQLLDDYTIFGYHTDTINLGLMKFVRTELLSTPLCSELGFAKAL